MKTASDDLKEFPVLVRFTRHTLTAIDNWRRRDTVIRPRSAVIRCAVDKYLKEMGVLHKDIRDVQSK